MRTAVLEIIEEFVHAVLVIQEILMDSPRLSDDDLSGYYDLLGLLSDEVCMTSKAVEENLEVALNKEE